MTAKHGSNFHGLTEDEILARIENGELIAQIARSVGVNRSALSRWLRAEPQRSARARESRKEAAAASEELAEQDIRDAADAFELAKAKELAHHRRWKASKLSPVYAEKLGIGAAEGLDPLQAMSETELQARITALLNTTGSVWVPKNTGKDNE